MENSIYIRRFKFHVTHQWLILHKLQIHVSQIHVIYSEYFIYIFVKSEDHSCNNPSPLRDSTIVSCLLINSFKISNRKQKFMQKNN